jgi:hypothetical protein
MLMGVSRASRATRASERVRKEKRRRELGDLALPAAALRWEHFFPRGITAGGASG